MENETTELSRTLCGSFHQTWDLDYNGNMIEVIEEIFSSDIDKKQVLHGIEKLLSSLERLPDVQKILQRVRTDYDPKEDGMTEIEWLVLIKQYLQGNNLAFSSVCSTSINKGE